MNKEAETKRMHQESNINLHNCDAGIANGVLCDVMHRLFQGVLTCKNPRTFAIHTQM